jgi:hypothetical protein
MKLPFDFAFEGFRIIREKPSLLLPWGLLTLAGFGATAVITSLATPVMADLQLAMSTNNVADIFAAAIRLLLVYAPVATINLVIQAVISCAVFRIVLGRPVSSFGALRFGKEELRQIAVSILFLLLAFVIYVAFVIAGQIFAVGLTLVVGGPSTPAGMISIFLIVLAVLLAVFYVLSRLTLCSAQSFDQGRINIFGSWALTKGNAGVLMLGYFVALLAASMVLFLCIGAFAAIVIAISGGDVSALERMQESATLGIQGLGNPVMIAYLIVVNGLVVPLLMTISFGAPAAAYRRLVNSGAAVENLF